MKSEASLQSMKDGAFLINCARGVVVCESDLYEVLVHGKLAEEVVCGMKGEKLHYQLNCEEIEKEFCRNGGHHKTIMEHILRYAP